MSNPTNCPFCGSTQLFSGSIRASDSYAFRPAAAPVRSFHLVLVNGIEFGPKACLCAHCGAIWAHANIDKARAWIETHGSPRAKALLNQGTSGGSSKSAHP